MFHQAPRRLTSQPRKYDKQTTNINIKSSFNEQYDMHSSKQERPIYHKYIINAV